MHRIALIGASISGSLSPLLHETEAEALGLPNFSYELIDLAQGVNSSDHLMQMLRDAAAEGFTGFNITHPCKQMIMTGLDALSKEAQHLQAVNTVTLRDGVMTGHNTDHSGFLGALRQGLGQRELGEVLLLGAGGAGAAVAHALLESGASQLTITDVDHQRAEQLSSALDPRTEQPVDTLKYAEVPEAMSRVDGVVNATPIGMDGYPGSPVKTSLLRSEMWVGDVVYRPFRTDLLRAAEELGCPTVLGAQMLVEQAADTFELLTGQVPDRQRMREHMRTLDHGRKTRVGQ